MKPERKAIIDVARRTWGDVYTTDGDYQLRTRQNQIGKSTLAMVQWLLLITSKRRQTHYNAG